MLLNSPLKMCTWAIAWAVLAAAWSTAQAADAKAGQVKANMCVTCHGAYGLSTMPNAPHLAGQPAIYIEEQLKQYRSGKRANEVMAVMAKPLTDSEIENLAAWYASIPIEVGQPR
ncbi:c-type cytochrome [Limnohabitans sp.]|jgi:cytochrome c553|uniref:c-type cytochrome n=1 Tax=Limnohabitans sp. TaxID=1907725 RepID=UPI0037C0D154